MEELNFTGNCLKGSRPILSFDSAFDKQPHLRVIRELLFHVFGVPQGARRSKPFVDHVMSFSYVDGKIWLRNYQINEVEESNKMDQTDEPGTHGETRKNNAKPGTKDTDINLVEIGPRAVLIPICIQEGSFGGPIIYENREFVSPNQVRSDLRRNRAGRHNARAEKTVERLSKRENLGLRSNTGRKKRDELDTRELFA
jgi:ribosome biogenesis protein BRX1